MRALLLSLALAAQLCAFGALAQPQEPQAAATLTEELARHQGTWVADSFRRDGEDAPANVVRTITRVVEGERVVWKREGRSFAATTVILDPARDPCWIDVIPEGGPHRGERILGIYRLDNDRLTICMADAGRPRPSEFQAEAGSGHNLMIFVRLPNAGK
jgi:uncharacterized protein (TIGR03067 family)